MKPEVLADDELFEEFIERVAEYTVKAMVGATRIMGESQETVFKAALSIGTGEGVAKGTFGVVFDASYNSGDELNAPIKASDRYGVCFCNFPTEARATEFADKFGNAMSRETREYSVRTIKPYSCTVN